MSSYFTVSAVLWLLWTVAGQGVTNSGTRVRSSRLPQLLQDHAQHDYLLTSPKTSSLVAIDMMDGDDYSSNGNRLQRQSSGDADGLINRRVRMRRDDLFNKEVDMGAMDSGPHMPMIYRGKLQIHYSEIYGYLNTRPLRYWTFSHLAHWCGWPSSRQDTVLWILVVMRTEFCILNLLNKQTNKQTEFIFHWKDELSCKDDP